MHVIEIDTSTSQCRKGKGYDFMQHIFQTVNRICMNENAKTGQCSALNLREGAESNSRHIIGNQGGKFPLTG